VKSTEVMIAREAAAPLHAAAPRKPPTGRGTGRRRWHAKSRSHTLAFRCSRFIITHGTISTTATGPRGACACGT